MPIGTYSTPIAPEQVIDQFQQDENPKNYMLHLIYLGKEGCTENGQDSSSILWDHLGGPPGCPRLPKKLNFS